MRFHRANFNYGYKYDVSRDHTKLKKNLDIKTKLVQELSFTAPETLTNTRLMKPFRALMRILYALKVLLVFKILNISFSRQSNEVLL